MGSEPREKIEAWSPGIYGLEVWINKHRAQWALTEQDAKQIIAAHNEALAAAKREGMEEACKVRVGYPDIEDGAGFHAGFVAGVGALRYAIRTLMESPTHD